MVLRGWAINKVKVLQIVDLYARFREDVTTLLIYFILSKCIISNLILPLYQPIKPVALQNSQ